jgi:hypothetical protein
VLNQAFGGSTLEACDHFFARQVLPVRPRSLLVYAGDNDLGQNSRAPQDLFDRVAMYACLVVGLFPPRYSSTLGWRVRANDRRVDGAT